MWVKSKIGKKEWSNYYSHIGGMTLLCEEGEHDVWVGFCMPKQTVDDRHIEIIDQNDLMKIQKHREASNYNPRPFD